MTTYHFSFHFSHPRVIVVARSCGINYVKHTIYYLKKIMIHSLTLFINSAANINNISK